MIIPVQECVKDDAFTSTSQPNKNKEDNNKEKDPIERVVYKHKPLNMHKTAELKQK